ncbi:sugar (Glycoside-Pentoside-Hexuronide) transporter [Thalassoporum mexicanum PCC 7367]|uniref:MFS transporter n=1 Tax=Thalassoporum mexicanum TaxID=3457544 RepID=UPI0002A000D9|nr:MFS transporter [Pseudanabaena sp. PCC 7367]AFY70714.1 sugar (Glycoside-Pentoside-Hexuronide) transporter [Pseudanabaena sp. PCC 7367]
MSQGTTSQSTASEQLAKPLSFSTKLAYGAGDLGTAITANILAFFLLYFFTNVAGMRPDLAGSVLLIAKVSDAINDPIVGVLSDRTNSRWGRRHPWMVAGALPFGVFFVMQWLVPTSNQWGLFFYYVAIAVLFNLFYTVVNLPYTAMTPELTQDYNERTSLNSFRFAFSIGGSIVSLLVAGMLLDRNRIPDQRLAYMLLGLFCAVVSVIAILWCVIGTRKRMALAEGERSSFKTVTPIPIRQQLKIVLSNRPFLYVIGIYFCSWLALQITASIIPFFVVNWMKMPEKQISLVSIGVQGTALLMLFVWSFVSNRYGKKAAYFMGMVLWIIAQAGLFLLQPGQVILLYILAIVAGIGVSVAYLIPWSMVPDVIELDELNTGQRREGIFYAFMVFLQKMGLAVGLWFLGIGLQLAGFQKQIPDEAVQPDSALMAIRIAIGPLPTIALILGLVLAYFYPITKEFHAQIMLQLHEKRLAEAGETIEGLEREDS